MKIRNSWLKLEPDEKIFTVLKHHWLVIGRRLLKLLVLAWLPPAIGLALTWFGLDYLLGDAIGRALVVLGASLYYLAIVAVWFYDWVDYYLDVWIITSHRIIDINQNGLFSRVVTQYRLERIQNVTADVSGFLHTVFNFGDVQVETAGAEMNLKMEQIPQPREVVQNINTWSYARRGEMNGGGGTH